MAAEKSQEYIILKQKIVILNCNLILKFILKYFFTDF